MYLSKEERIQIIVKTVDILSKLLKWKLLFGHFIFLLQSETPLYIDFTHFPSSLSFLTQNECLYYLMALSMCGIWPHNLLVASTGSYLPLGSSEFIIGLPSLSAFSLYSFVSSWSPSRASSYEINHVEDNQALWSLLLRPLVPLPCFSILPTLTSFSSSSPPLCSVQCVRHVNAALWDVLVFPVHPGCPGLCSWHHFTPSASDVILRHTRGGALWCFCCDSFLHVNLVARSFVHFMNKFFFFPEKKDQDKFLRFCICSAAPSGGTVYTTLTPR